MLGLRQMAVFVKTVLCCPVGLRLIGHRELVSLRTHVEVFTQRITHKIVTHEETAHVGMTKELDAEEVEDLALKQVSIVPQTDDRRQHIVVTVHHFGNLLHRDTLVALCILKNVNTAEAFLTEVLANDCH